MAYRTGIGACWLLLALLCAPALAQGYDGDLPARWQLRADTWTGELTLSIGPTGKVSGILGGRTVSGVLSGRRLVLQRTVEGGVEVWDGWLPEASSASPFLAGSVAVGGRVYPWYAVPEGAGQVAGTTDEPGWRRATEPEALAQPTEPARSASSAFRAAAAADPGTWALLTGIWTSTEGRAEIVHEGRTLTVTLPGGSEVVGRFTATDTIVVGIRKGCCKGVLQGPNIIKWSDGAIWQRSN